MPTTPNRGYVYPSPTAPATVPTDIQIPLEQIDADVQDLMDRVAASEQLVIVHSGDGLWTITTGLGDSTPVNDHGDGLYSIGA